MPHPRQRTTVALLSALALLVVGLLAGPAAAHSGSGIAVDRLGRIYFLDTGSGLWRIDTDGKVTRLSEVLSHWLAIDEENRFADTQLPSGALGDITRVG